MRVKMLTAISGAEQSLRHGDVVEVSDEVGAAWMAEGLADAAGDSAVDQVHASATVTPVDEPTAESTKADDADVEKKAPARRPRR